MSAAALSVIHIDGRVGHVFGVEKIESDSEYAFRFKLSHHLTYTHEIVSGKHLTEMTAEQKIKYLDLR